MEVSPSHEPSPRRGPLRPFASVFRDDRGQVTLLAAMMCFLAAFFAILAFNTNFAIRNRIMAQNAVDSAASSAALWQARGCNLVQTLNNLHYRVDQVAGAIEVAAAAACVLAEIPYFKAACVACVTLPVVDAGQQQFTVLVTNIQQVIVDATPFVAFINANANAYGSGADPIAEVLVGYAAAWLDKLGLPSAAGILSDGLAFLPEIPVYAVPIDPTSLSLETKLKAGEGFPWQLPALVGEIGDLAGQTACPGYGSARSVAKAMGWDEKWGWDDAYFFGNPGFMTWIAGKKKHDELLGLGNVAWLNGGSRPIDDIPMFKGDVRTSAKLEIPAMAAIASSQVEGEPVIDHGEANAKGKLIKVHFSRKFSGDSIGIFH